MAIKKAKHVISPQEGVQTLAFTTKADIIIFGGSAGCLDGQTEYLSLDGWKKISQYSEGDQVFTFDPDNGTAFFEKPARYVKTGSERLIHFKNKDTDQRISVDHLFLHQNPDKSYCWLTVGGILDNLYPSFDPTFINTFKVGSDSVTQEFFSKLGNNNVDDKQLLGCSQGQPSHIVNGKLKRSRKKLKLFGSKRSGQKVTIWKEDAQYCFTTSTGAFVCRRNGKIFITGNSGKSHLLLMQPLQHVNDPDFHAIFFRRVTTQLVGAGGLWPESKKMYSPFKIKTKTKPQLQHTFPSGATITFSHMQHPDDCEQHQGLQYSAVMWDELTHFHEKSFIYLLSRLRSEADVDSYCMASCNPDNASWVLKWVEWYLDDKGYFDKTKEGVLRYYIVVEDRPIFAATPEELIEQYPDYCCIKNERTGKMITITPKSFIFLGGTIFDNPILIEKNPKYLAELNALPRVEKARLRDGCWYAKAKGANYFQQEWLHKAVSVPDGCISVRAWDKGYSEPSETYRHPDYTASVKMYKSSDNEYYIVGDYDEQCRDAGSDIVGRYRKRFGQRNQWMMQQCCLDGTDTTVVIPKEKGAGKGEFEDLCKMFTNGGFTVRGADTTKDKLQRFSTFSAACQNGLVHIVESSFSNKATLEAFYEELTSFTGARSTAYLKDDWVDCCSDCFLALQRECVIRPSELAAALSGMPTTGSNQFTAISNSAYR